MSLQICPRDPITYQVLPYLDRSDLLQVRLVSSAFRDAVNDLMQATRRGRGGIDDPTMPRRGVLMRTATASIPRSLNDMTYVFRIFQRASWVINFVYQELSLPPASLGVSLETIKRKSDEMNAVCLADLRKFLAADPAFALELNCIKNCTYFEHASLLVLSITSQFVVVRYIERLSALQGSTYVLDRLLRFRSAQTLPISTRLLQDLFVELAECGHISYLDEMMQSSRGGEIREVLYEALEAAEENQHWDCVDFLSSHIQAKTSRGHAISCSAMWGLSLAYCSMDSSAKTRRFAFVPAVIGSLGAFHYLAFRGSILGRRLKITWSGTPITHASITPFFPNRIKNILLVVSEVGLGILYTTAGKSNTPVSSIVKNAGLGALIYGILSACKMPRAARILVGRNIYPIAMGTHCLFHCLTRRTSARDESAPVMLGALISAVHFYLSRSSLFL